MPTTGTLWQQIYDRGVLSAVKALDAEQSKELAQQFGTNNYKPLPVNVVRADGSHLWDNDGREYIDCIGSYSAVAHGHLNARIIAALQEQLEAVTLTSRAFYTSELALFSKALAEFCELDMICPMNTGAEANETAIKIARKWAYTVKGVPKDQAEIIVCTDNFHGRTTTIVGFSTEEQYKELFGPYSPGFKIIPFGDIEALKAAITPNTAAFLVEPIQAEGGIIIPPTGYLKQVRDLCTAQNVLLIFDEVQTGFCRTGKRFAWMHEDAKPDIITVGKALGGGLLPVAAAVGTRAVMQVFKPGDHGSTFGGNPLAAAVGLASMATMIQEDFDTLSATGGQFLLDGFQSFNSPLVKEVRSRGMLVGLEIHDDVDGYAVTDQLLANGLVTKETRHHTFRFTPPITTPKAVLGEIVERVGRALKAVEQS